MLDTTSQKEVESFRTQEPMTQQAEPQTWSIANLPPLIEAIEFIPPEVPSVIETDTEPQLTVWQFCVALLQNNKYNPEYIHWLNEPAGIF